MSASNLVLAGYRVNKQTIDRGWYWAGAGFCVLMLGIHIAAARNLVGIADFWRDMYWATSIAYGERFPLAGPPIYHLIELGPWWYYVLALPIIATHSITAAAVLGQILAAAKYALAWQIGTRLLDARFGLAFCVSLALAGWSTASLVFPTHTALVETTLLLLVVATWRCRDQLSFGNSLVLGLACAACIHAHPSTAPYLILAGAVILHWHGTKVALPWLCLTAALVLLSLAPPLFDRPAPDEQGFGPPKSFLDYARRDLGVNLWTRLPRMLTGLGTGGAWTGFMLMTPWQMPAIRWAFAVHTACLVFALSGLALLWRQHRVLLRWFAYALLILLAQCAFLLVVRLGTPIWMTQSCLVPLAFAIALGWYGWFVATKAALRVSAAGVFVIYTLLDLAPFQRYLGHARYNRTMPDSNPLADLSGGSASFEQQAIPFFPISHFVRLSPKLCEPMVLHARLATVVENALATPVRNACGFWPELHYAGVEPGTRHVAGISARAVSTIGIVPDQLVAGLAWYNDARAIAPPHGLGITHLERRQVMPDAVYVGLVLATYDFDARPGDVVAMTNRFGIIAPMEIRQITADGLPARKVFDEGDSVLYLCNACTTNDTMRWHIELNGIQENLDVVVIPSEKTSAATPGVAALR